MGAGRGRRLRSASEGEPWFSGPVESASRFSRRSRVRSSGFDGSLLGDLGEDLGDLFLLEGLLLEEALDHEVELVAVLGHDLARLVVRFLDEPADLGVDLGGDDVRVVLDVAEVAARGTAAIRSGRARGGRARTSRTGSPSAWRSACSAGCRPGRPVVGSSKTISSATRPPSSIASSSISSERVTRNRSSVGSVSV